MEALFSVGQRVVCVDSSSKSGFNPPSLIEGKVYTVKGNEICSCGVVGVDVGLRLDTNATQVCYECCRIISRDICYANQFRFVPLDDNDAIEDEIRESLNLHLKV